MENHKIKYLSDYRQPDYLIDSIDLKIDLDEETTTVNSIMKIRRNLSVADETTPLVLDCNHPEIVSVIAEDMVLLPEEYEVSETSFILPKVPESFTLEITTLLKPQENTSMMGLYKSGGTFCTQCEAEGFRKITCYPDRPDVMTSFSCIITADKSRYPVLLSNGNPVAKGDLDNNRHFVHWKDPFKKPSYLFALVAGDLVCIQDKFVTSSGRTVDLHIYVEPENADKCSHAMRSLKQAMKWDEDRFGREYDLDLYQIVAVNDFNMGAMENKGLNIFNSKYVLARPETATDIDFMNIQAVVAHEYFHNWTGNRITLKNWFQLSLKEGLTVFRDQEFTSDLNSRPVKRLMDVKKLRTFQFPEDSGPMTHPVRPESYIEMNNFYTLTVYDKGAEVIRMMYQILGKDNFRKAMDLYFERFDGQAVTTEDFVKTMEDASGIDLTQFRLWYSQSGTPVVNLARRYDEKARRLFIDLAQTISPDRNQSQKLPMHIPVRFGLIDDSGKDIPLEKNQTLLHLVQEKMTFQFDNINPGTLPSVFREFSAPVILKTDLSDLEISFLMAHDSDPFNRWDAAQELFFRELKSLVNAIHQDRPTVVSDHLTEAFHKALTDRSSDMAIIARTLTLPDENEIAMQFDEIDVDAIHHARQRLKHHLASTFKTDLEALVNKLSQPSDFDISFKSMSERSLKNLALSYLGALGTDELITRIYHLFSTSTNMTDEIGSLSILVDCDSPYREKALQQFYDKWKHDPLVMDKWFTVQAMSIIKGTHLKVVELSKHPDYSMTNPNRIRSLTAAFAFQNPVCFHSIDGLGYAFVSKQIQILDKTNAQISARLASSFNRWKKYDKKRQELMRQELETILNKKSLSKDVFEIVSRALE